MRRLRDHSAPHLRPVLSLEMLEDRRLLSAGGLLNTLLPLQPAAPPSSSGAAPLSRVFAPLEAPAATTTSLLDAPLTPLSPVTTAVQDLGGPGNPPASPTASAGGLDLNVHLNVDVLFIHAGNVDLDVGVNPVGSGQPLLSGGLGASIRVGPPTGGLVTLIPQVGIDVGGPGAALLNIGGSSAPIIAGGGVTLTVGDGPGGDSGGPVVSVPPILPGGGQGASAPGAGPTLPDAPPAQAGGASAPPAMPDAPPTPPASPAVHPVLDGPAPETSASPAQVVAAALPAPAGGRSAVPLPGMGSATGVDGGGGLAADGAPVTPPVADVQPGGGGADQAVLPVPGGASDRVVEGGLAPDAAGLATHFQPGAVGGATRALTDLLGRITPQKDGLGAWLARLQQLAPWLVGLAVAGAAFAVRRRRAAKAAKAAARPAAG